MPNTGTDHIVTSYNEELLSLAQAIAEMGGQVEVAIENGTRALLKLDRELADLTARFVQMERDSLPGGPDE